MDMELAGGGHAPMDILYCAVMCIWWFVKRDFACSVAAAGAPSPATAPAPRAEAVATMGRSMRGKYKPVVSWGTHSIPPLPIHHPPHLHTFTSPSLLYMTLDRVCISNGESLSKNVVP